MTVAGNVGLARTTTNALGLAHLLDLDVPVHAGAGRPLVGEVLDAATVHGESGLAGATLQVYVDRIRDLTGASGEAALHDPCAVLALTHPGLFSARERWVRVECEGRRTRGMTLVDQRPWVSGGNVEWCETIDAAAATELIVQSIAAAP